VSISVLAANVPAPTATKARWTRRCTNVCRLLHRVAGGGITRLRLVQSGFGPEAVWDDEFADTKSGWADFLKKLKGLFGNNPHMRRIPWSTIALGSLLVISACLKGGQEVQFRNLKSRSRPSKWSSAGASLESAVSSSNPLIASDARMYAKHLDSPTKAKA